MDKIIEILGPLGFMSILIGIVFFGLFFIAKKQYDDEKNTK